ncbi:uncharacterized protein [Montipora capricornis]|uniref:uncharacterized protein n=1 Tax=Montipora capricornis TaxID=246305 RepID=UPI0035F16FCE
MEINSEGENGSNVPKGKSRLFHADERKPRTCVYCERGDYVSSACTHLTTLDERKRFLARCSTEYGQIIEQQKSEGIVEEANKSPQEKEFYIPHKPVVRIGAESTKLRVVYDASARFNPQAPSLNDCLYAGPPLQNHLWNVLVRMRFHPVLITGDLKQVFLQVRIKKQERDTLRFHWKANEHWQVETLRFTRVSFGLVPSPFLLGGVIESHLESWEPRRPELVAELHKSLYVDDLISGKPTVKETEQLKQGAIEVFEDAKFTLHEWHSNAAELEENGTKVEEEESFAKQQLRQPGGRDGSLLGLSWEKRKHEISVAVPQENVITPKKGILRKLAKIYDPLGLAASLTLKGKSIYRDGCKAKLAWDAPLPSQLACRWSCLERELPPKVTTPRALKLQREEIEEIELHAFGDASVNGVSATVHAVVKQRPGVNTGLVEAKARLAKQGLTIPPLELVSAHMATNLINNVRCALEGFPVKQSFGWLDKFVMNRVRKIQAHPEITWRHVPTQENFADLGSRGGQVTDNPLWWQWQQWLTRKEEWPPDLVTSASPETMAEAKATRKIFAAALAATATDELDALLDKFCYWKAIRAYAWIKRFLFNVRTRTRMTGPLTTQELNLV